MTIPEILSKLDKLWVNKIKEKGLVKTGKLYHSVHFIETDKGISMIAEDYYLYLDTKYSVSKEIIATKEFKDLISEYGKKKVELILMGQINDATVELKTIIK